MSKERLKGISKEIAYLDDSVDMQDTARFHDTIDNMYKDGDLHWVLKYAKEQAKQVENYKKACTQWEVTYGYEREQSNHYRESIKLALSHIRTGNFNLATIALNKSLLDEVEI